MLLVFACEICGKRFKVDERSRGKRGRCSHCGHVMRIPQLNEAPGAVASPPPVPAPAPVAAAAAVTEPAFKLSPPESRPAMHTEEPRLPPEPVPARPVGPHSSVFGLASPVPANRQRPGDQHIRFDLVDEDADPAAIVPVSPEIARGLREIEEFQRDPRGYAVASEQRGFLWRLDRSKPAGWLYLKWRGAVGFLLKILRWIDSWAYLISVPFIVLMIFGIVAEQSNLVHVGAVVTVLANYGRFWADLLAFFLRPYKDGPIQGLAFLFPPYTLYYLTVHWDRMRPIVRRIATSCIPIVAVILMYSYLASVNPAVKDAKGIQGHLEAGNREVNREVGRAVEQVEEEVLSGVERVEERVRSLNAPKRSASGSPSSRKSDD
jgi:hypothetical protein